MNNNTLTIQLEGDVSLADFVNTMTHFNRFITELSKEVTGDDAIEWVIDDLQAGSALATVVGFSPEQDKVARVIDAYERVGEAVESNTGFPYSDRVRNELVAITKKISDKITAIRFETAKHDYITYQTFDGESVVHSKPQARLGTVKGRVQSISSRGRLTFKLYDGLFDQAITCYVKEDKAQEEKMKAIWGNVVWVTGLVLRDYNTGRAKSVREITRIDIVPTVEPGSYKKAMGALAWMGDEPAEVTIRRLRDED